MDIRLGGKYRLKSDGLNIWIEEEYINKKGNPDTRNVTGYHGKLENCLNSFADKKIKESECDTQTKLLKEVKGIRKELKTMCEELRTFDTVRK